MPLKESTTPIPLAHISNSSDDSKEAGPSNSLEAEDDYYKMLLEDCAKDCVYFDSAPQLVNETNEEVTSQSRGESNKIKSDNDSNSSNSEEEMPDDSEMMDIMDMVDIMNMVNIIEVITIVTEDTKEKPPQ